MAGDETPRELGLRLARSASVANEWSLVLAAAGIASQVARTPEGFVLRVDPADARRAEAELAAHVADEAAAEHARRRAQRPRPEFRGSAPRQLAIAVTLAMVGFYGVTGPGRADAAWFDAGSADAIAIRSGELWRTVTALCLHADLAHLAANALFGTLLLGAVGRGLGPGVALALVVVSGATGNAVNAFLRSTAHVSIGASTAVFGAVGVLSGFAIARRAERGEPWRRTVAPFAAGLGILAMIGSGGDRVDVFAHLFGLLAGMPLGLAAGLVLARPPSARAQWAVGSAAAALVVASWQLALG